jgi:Protein of unknown function (DUF3040)
VSLSAHEQQVLNRIEDRLSGSDPKLAALLATFARLTAGEEMPVREKIQERGRRLSRSRVWLAFWLLIGVALIAVAVAVSSGSGGSQAVCAGPWAVACAGHSAARSATPRPAWLAVWLPG